MNLRWQFRELYMYNNKSEMYINHNSPGGKSKRFLRGAGVYDQMTFSENSFYINMIDRKYKIWKLLCNSLRIFHINPNHFRFIYSGVGGVEESLTHVSVLPYYLVKYCVVFYVLVWWEHRYFYLNCPPPPEMIRVIEKYRTTIKLLAIYIFYIYNCSPSLHTYMCIFQ